MRQLVGLSLLLLIQIRPMVGAGLCMQVTARSEHECSMPVSGPAAEDHGSQRGTPQDCAQRVVCASATSVVAQAVLDVFEACLPCHSHYSTPPLLHPGDHPAPPQPPPIA